jgi:lipopolysaccharide/colanic/teichoic acid biosynthesis glycosyltransferase
MAKFETEHSNSSRFLSEIERIKNLSNNFLIVDTRKVFNLVSNKPIDLLINYEKTNNIKKINKFHETVNQILPLKGIYISCVESSDQRKARKSSKYIFLFSPILLFTDFIYKRVVPKLPIIKQIYFALTEGKNRVMSETEILGRLVSCGFEINKIYNHKGLTFIFSTKIREPYYDMNPSYGPIFKMRRIGYKGKIISVYKFRTMSPYSEYIQSAIIKKNRLDKTGKINDDYRITFYGKFLRKYWIDELPMIINWLKRDLKIVGVRPLSEDYFSRYPEDLKELRIKTKPGLVPPYYVDLPVTFEEICDSERNYLIQYFKSPYKTDLVYFFKSAWNILIKRKRSR